MINYITNTYVRILYLHIKALFISAFKRKEISSYSDKIAFVMLAANYNNLGDIAITMFQEKYLKSILPADYEVIVIPHDETFQVYFSMRRLINDNTIITLIGGGNSGSLYEFIEWPRRFILEKFRNCKIISFPQSVYYGNSDINSYYKRRFEKLCKKCSNLTLVAREGESYKRYKEMDLTGVKVILTPDIVFTGNIPIYEREKNNKIALVFRNDLEKSLDSNYEEILSKWLSEQFFISRLDTCDVNISGNGYEDLNKYLKALSDHDIVFTDRLHGMILSYILGLKCVVFDNNNHKIRSTVETWLSNDKRIKFCDKIINPQEELLSFEYTCYLRNDFTKEFEKLKGAILNG